MNSISLNNCYQQLYTKMLSHINNFIIYIVPYSLLNPISTYSLENSTLILCIPKHIVFEYFLDFKKGPATVIDILPKGIFKVLHNTVGWMSLMVLIRDIFFPLDPIKQLAHLLQPNSLQLNAVLWCRCRYSYVSCGSTRLDSNTRHSHNKSLFIYTTKFPNI